MSKNILKEWDVEKHLSQDILKAHEKIPDYILQILYNRKIFNLKDSKKKRTEKIERFINPSYDDLFDPFLMKDTRKAVKRIKRALKNNERIAIFGDYDADGITSSAVLYEVFKFLCVEALVYIPHRDKEGYGLNIKAIKKISKKKIKLLITVDCGIKNIEEIKEAKRLGIDVIITDHHEVTSKIPPAYAVINPKQKKCFYPFKKLAGVGIAFKLAQGLIKEIDKGKKGEIFLKWLLDLVAIGTIGDSVPLISENRILVKFGLLVYEKTRRVGLLELKKTMRNGSSKNLGFYLIPRLNAAGRMDHANWAFLLLVTESHVESLKLINKIEKLNKKRREETERIVEEARKETGFLDQDQKIIILANENWSSALSGIVAGRLAEENRKPTLIIEIKGEISKGSARSFHDFNIAKALEEIKFLFEKTGGHKEAAGFTYKTKNHDKIVYELSKKALKEIKDDFRNSILIDLEVDYKKLDINFYKYLQELSPFGESNPEPAFLVKNIKVLEKRLVGLNKHLKMKLEKNSKKIDAIGFRKGKLGDGLGYEECVDLVFRINENSYRGFLTIELEVLDLVKSKSKKKEII